MGVEIDDSSVIDALNSLIDNILPQVFLELGPELVSSSQTITQSISANPSGKLSSAWEYNINGNTLELTNSLDYASYWFNGRGPVVPVHAKALHWVSASVDIFTKYSGSFGGYETDFMKEIENTIENNLEEIVNNVLKQAGL
jgi:hypothetical protein